MYLTTTMASPTRNTNRPSPPPQATHPHRSTVSPNPPPTSSSFFHCSLFQLYIATHDLLHEYNSTAKFVAIKAILGIAVLQSMVRCRYRALQRHTCRRCGTTAADRSERAQ